MFRSSQYEIKKIPLNYQIKIKLPHLEPKKGVDRFYYAGSLEEAHQVANRVINTYFRSGTAPQNVTNPPLRAPRRGFKHK